MTIVFGPSGYHVQGGFDSPDQMFWEIRLWVSDGPNIYFNSNYGGCLQAKEELWVLANVVPHKRLQDVPG